MTYRAHVPEHWREMQEATARAESRNRRASERLNRLRWRRARYTMKRTAFWIVFALVIIAALCGLSLGGFASTRRGRR